MHDHAWPMASATTHPDQWEATMKTGTRHHLRFVSATLILAVALALAFAAIALLGPVDRAQGAALIRLSPAQMEELASTIVAAQVVDTQVCQGQARVADAPRGYIETVVTLKVLKAQKGAPQSPGDTITIVIPGGTLGDLTLVVDTSPSFQRGEAVQLYLDDRGQLVGGFQGKRELSITESALYGALPTVLPTVMSGATAVAPLISSITPASASAGTGSKVTVTGSGFGATQGSGHVNFFYRTGQPTITAPVVSWSDTSIVCIVPTGTVNGYPASAGSGPVTVTNNDGLVSSSHLFSVTFAYGGYKWPTAVCSYRVNPNTADTTVEESLVDAGAQVWNAASSFKYADAGLTSSTAWSYNGSNEIFWTGRLSVGILGQAWTWYSGTNILETDIGFNDYYKWGAGTTGTMDVQTVAMHELGHWLNLRDLYGSGDSAKVMYGFASSGTVKRALSVGDIAGISWIYGSGATTQFTLATSVVGAGSITRNPDQATYTQGSTVTLTAVPAAGYTFSSWSGGATGTANPTTLTMDSNKTVTATFVAGSTTLRYEEADSRLYFAGGWYLARASGCSGGAYKHTRTVGSSVTIKFNGTGIDYIASMNYTQGLARVTLDGGTPVTVNLYSPTVKYQQKVWSVSGLTAGEHTVRVDCLGKSGGGAGYGVNLDALDVTGTLVSAR
jgi:hypothetical protein